MRVSEVRRRSSLAKWSKQVNDNPKYNVCSADQRRIKERGNEVKPLII